MSSSEPGAAGAPPHAPSATALLSQALALTGQLLESSRPEGEADDSQQAVLQALRSLRNACAGDAAACEQLLGLGLVTLLRNVVRLVQASVISLNWQVPLVAAQAIANAANTSAAFAAAAWAALFPLQLTTLAHVCSGRRCPERALGLAEDKAPRPALSQPAPCAAEPLQSALSMGVLACCKRVPGAAQALAGPAGGTLLTALLCSQTRLQQEVCKGCGSSVSSGPPFASCLIHAHGPCRAKTTIPWSCCCPTSALRWTCCLTYSQT